jgi:hypothetical protein
LKQLKIHFKKYKLSEELLGIGKKMGKLMLGL